MKVPATNAKRVERGEAYGLEDVAIAYAAGRGERQRLMQIVSRRRGRLRKLTHRLGLRLGGTVPISMHNHPRHRIGGRRLRVERNRESFGLLRIGETHVPPTCRVIRNDVGRSAAL